MTNSKSSDPIERAKTEAGRMYPQAQIRTRMIHGRPAVLAYEDNVIYVVGLI